MALVKSKEKEIGWIPENFVLKNIDGSDVSIYNYSDKKGVLVIFTCNHCPYAQVAWPITNNLYEEFGNKVEFIAVNSNDTEAFPADNFENMKKYSIKKGIKHPYVIDKDQLVAKEFDAQCTPDPYLFKFENGKPKLFYHGRVDDSFQFGKDYGNPEETKFHDLKNAIKDLLEGNDSPMEQMPSMGCSIKWRD